MKIKKILATSFITFFASFIVLSTPVFAAETSPAEPFSSSDYSTIAPCSDIIRYRYKEENGKVYRRLFNYTRDEWAEDSWHLVG